jgi:hypothetical protein
MEAIYGVTVEALAEITSKQSELRTQFGEAQGNVAFERWLAERGLDHNTYAHAHNAWHERFRADPTGRLQAQFHMHLQQLSTKAHFGDVRDMSQDTEEGITLDQYAQIAVAISRKSKDLDTVVKEFGLRDAGHWHRASDAWTRKMGADTTHKLSVQYGTLYQKYAGPAFQEEVANKIAASLAEANKPRDVVDEPEAQLTPEVCLRKMQSTSRKERWRAAYHYAHMADVGNVPDKAIAIANVTPVLLEMIESHDDETTSDAESAARSLWDLGNRSDDFRGAVQRCLNRAREKLTSLEAAFAPIQNQAIPERIFLQSKIRDHRSLVETMTEYANEDWNSGPKFADHGFGGAPVTRHGAPTAPARSGGGTPKWIAVPIVLAIAGSVVFATRTHRIGQSPRLASSLSATATASVSATAATAPSSSSAAAVPSNSAPTTKASTPVKSKAPTPAKKH